MKTLKRNDEFKRVKDTSIDDYKEIKRLLDFGWGYSNKKDWKEWKNQSELKKEKVEKPEKVEKKEKREKKK